MEGETSGGRPLLQVVQNIGRNALRLLPERIMPKPCVDPNRAMRHGADQAIPVWLVKYGIGVSPQQQAGCGDLRKIAIQIAQIERLAQDGLPEQAAASRCGQIPACPGSRAGATSVASVTASSSSHRSTTISGKIAVEPLSQNNTQCLG